MEVVLANGEVMRTGMGALPNAKTWQNYKSGYGPWIDGLFSQSNFGVVTKMGFWLMPEPEAYLSGIVSVPKHGDLVRFIEILNELDNQQVFNGMPLFGSPLMNENFDAGESLRTPPAPELAALLGKKGGPSPAEIDAYAQKVGKGVWGVKLQFYGPREVIEAQWKHAQKKYSEIPGAKFTGGDVLEMPLSEEQLAKVHKVNFGIPNLQIFFIGARSDTNPTPGQGHIWFSPIIPRTGEAILEAQRVFNEVAQEFGFPISPLALPGTYWHRNFIYIFGFPITHDPEINKKNRANFKKLIKIAADHGWGEYRTAPAYMDDVMDVYSFNNHALRRFHETVKDAIDPNGILSAGRYGIWPKHLRK
jgi:4-cresol dehydrogenase (hydroxylating)